MVSWSIHRYFRSPFHSVFPSSYVPRTFFEELTLHGHLFFFGVRKSSSGCGYAVGFYCVCAHWWCSQGRRCPGSCDSISFPASVSFFVAQLYVRVSHAYRSRENTSARRILILYCMKMVLPFHLVFRLESSVIIWSWSLVTDDHPEVFELLYYLKFLARDRELQYQVVNE